MAETGGMALRASELVAGAVALQVLGLAGTWGMVQGTADRRWQELTVWAQQECAEFERREFARDVAWGDANDGAAFAHYARALELAAARTPAFPGWDRVTELDAAEVAALTADWAAPLDALHDGAHCRDVRPLHSLTNGCDQRLGRWREGDSLVRAAFLAARQDVVAGDPRCAVERVLDAATMACDLLRSPWDRRLGCWLLRTLAESCVDDWLAACDCAALDRLAAGLARLDTAWPFQRAIHDALVVDADGWLRSSQPEFVSGVWQYAFSRRWMLAAGVMDAARAFAPAADRVESWPRRQRLLQELAHPLVATANPMGQETCWWLEREWRRAVASLRLLRTAIDVHRGLAPQPLVDPLGDGVIAVQATADGVRLVSGTAPGKDAIERTARAR